MKNIILIYSILFSAPAFAQTDSSYNTGFETTYPGTIHPRGWYIVNNETQSKTWQELHDSHRIDSQEVHSGNYAFLVDMDKTEKEWSGTGYTIDGTFKGKTIKLKGYMKTKDVATSAGIWMRVDCDIETGIEFDNMDNRPVTGTTGWTEYEITLPYDSKRATSVTIGALISGKGKIWFDDFHVTVDGKDIARAKRIEHTTSPATLDTAYRNGSGINTITLHDTQIKNLQNLGMLWGFIKYYHPAVAAGKHNMDAELFRVLPLVLAGKNTDVVNTVLEKWLDNFEVPTPCKKCAHIDKAKVKLNPDYGYLFAKNNLPPSLVKKLEFIKDNREKLTEHYYIKLIPNVSNPEFAGEYNYDNIVYPDAGIRLLALYRYWNMIHYFSPNRHLTDTPWKDVLSINIPDFINAADSAQYAIACVRLIGMVNDTHAGIGGSTKDIILKMQGSLGPPFRCRFIENKLVVTNVFHDFAGEKLPLNPGDIINAIDGQPVDELLKKYLPLTAGSNHSALLRDVCRLKGWLLKSDKVEMKLSVNTGDETKEVLAKRVMINDTLWQLYDSDYGKNEGYKLLDGNIGYIYPALLEESSIDSIKKMMTDTKGVVIDFRCYPSATIPYAYGEWLKEKKSDFVKITIPSIDIPGYFSFTATLQNGGGKNSAYKGKVVIIVDEYTQSAAEFSVMALSTAPNCTVIGTTTSGADGNISRIGLPGGVITIISGIGCIYPDGTESQRLGVKINKVVPLTVQGIRQGRDIQMEAALEIINKG